MKKIIKVIMSIILCVFVLDAFAFGTDRGIKILDSEETTRISVSDTLDRDEHIDITSYVYKNGLEQNPFKYVSVNHAISYINKSTGNVLGVVTFLSKFKYNKNDKQAICLSTSWGGITENLDYAFKCFSRKVNTTSCEGGGIYKIDFKYKGITEDHVEYNCLCDYVGNITIL